MFTRTIIIQLEGSDQKVLEEYAEEIADLADEAMISQERTNNIPPGVKYEGTGVIDPDNPDADEEPDIVSVFPKPV